VKIDKKEKSSIPTNYQIYREKIDWQEACKFDSWLVWMMQEWLSCLALEITRGQCFWLKSCLISPPSLLQLSTSFVDALLSHIKPTKEHGQG